MSAPQAGQASQPKAGAAIEPSSFGKITQDRLNRYSMASGDPNPIHLDEAAAKKAGLPGVIAHGMLVAGLIAERAVAFAQSEAGGGWKLVRYQNRFKAMTLLGDEVIVGGTVKAATESTMSLELAARNHRGEVTTTGVAEFRR